MLHTRKSLQAKIEAVARGEAELTEDSKLERYALMRAFARGELVPHVEYDQRAALARAIDFGFEMQALDAAPPTVRESPALLLDWLQRAAEARRPLLSHLQAEPFGANPTVVRPDADTLAAELRALEDEFLITPPPPKVIVETGSNGERVVRTEHPDPSDLVKQIDAAWEAGRLGRLGKFLCSFNHDDQAKLRTVDEAFCARRGWFSKLCRISRARDIHGRLEDFESHAPLQLPTLHHYPCSAIVGAEVSLGWLCELTTDAPPAELCEHGTWAWQELKSRPGVGVYRFSPKPKATP